MIVDLQTRISELEEALRHAEWQAQAAVRAKEALVANISHELHTPLSAILGFAELLREDARHGRYDTVTHDLDKIMQAGLQLLSRINELLDFSKLETHTVSLRSVSFDLGQELERILTDLRPLMEYQGNHFQLTLNQQGMVGDPDKVRQILHNLLDNANKFTAAGSIALRVAPHAQNGVAGVQFVVQDTGIGMTAEQTQQIFEAFTQVDLSTTRHYEGLGIGLYICRQLCQLMGGEINVQTEPGRGSVFTVWLPSG